MSNFVGKRRKILAITPSVIIELVRQHAVLPDDLRYVALRHDQALNRIDLLVESETFPELPEGASPEYYMPSVITNADATT